MSPAEPRMPETKPVTVEVDKTALLVLDLTEACANPNHASHKLVPEMSKFLDRAREAGMLIVFTVSLYLKGTKEGQVYSGFKRKPSEAVLFPDGFDKFAGGDLESLLRLYEDIDTLIITGCNSNINVLHTAIKATRELNYQVVIPIDGLAAASRYAEEYALFHLANMPGRPDGGTNSRLANRFFTKFDMIKFGSRS